MLLNVIWLVSAVSVILAFVTSFVPHKVAYRLTQTLFVITGLGVGVLLAAVLIFWISGG